MSFEMRTCCSTDVLYQWWRPTGVPGLWYMTGSFLWTQTFSAVLALRIAAIERGLNPAHYEEDNDMRSRMKAD